MGSATHLVMVTIVIALALQFFEQPERDDDATPLLVYVCRDYVRLSAGTHQSCVLSGSNGYLRYTLG